VCAVPAAAQQPEPPLPANNGWIAFASDRGLPWRGGFRLYRLEPVGAVTTPLDVAGRYPAWSPDGSLVAYVDARLRVVVAQPDGRIVQVLAHGRYLARDPAWSPDGSRIAFTRGGPRRVRGDLYVAAADGSSLRRITRSNHDDREPTWSPDGSLIAFASDRPERLQDYEINVVRPGGSGLQPLTENEFDDRSPAWSPDGAKIVFTSRRTPGILNPELWTMSPSGELQSRVQPATAQEPWGRHVWADMDAAWSPDGRWLAYVTTERWGYDDIFIVEVGTGRKFDLTPEAPSFEEDPAWQPVCHVMGTSGDDVQVGTSFDDLVCGFDGNDVLTGGPGRDRLFGGFGRDTIRARDAERDIVGCGPGRDEVVADRSDLVGVDCERVRRR
jgi:Tol biopolymer transport system component